MIDWGTCVGNVLELLIRLWRFLVCMSRRLLVVIVSLPTLSTYPIQYLPSHGAVATPMDANQRAPGEISHVLSTAE